MQEAKDVEDGDTPRHCTVCDLLESDFGNCTRKNMTADGLDDSKWRAYCLMP